MNAALLLIVALLPSAPEAPDDFDTFFAKFAEKRAGIRILEADIAEDTLQFGDRTERHGHLVFGRPRRILFRYEGEEPSMMVDNRRVYEYDPFEEQVQIYDIEDSPEASIFFLGFDSDPSDLREAYDLRLFRMESEKGHNGIEIRPFKENQNQAPFQELTIYLRDEDYLPYRIDIEIDDDTHMVTEFSNYKVNQPIDPPLTQLRIAAGTRVIENGDVTIRAVPAGGMLMPEAPLDPGVPAPAANVTPEHSAEPAVEVQDLPAP